MPAPLLNPLPTRFWLALETVLGGTALPTTWKNQLDSSFDLFKSFFLKERPDQRADSVPCPWNCGCFHEVVLQSNGTFHGICQCNPRKCGTYTVLPWERIPLELDWPRLASLLGRAFGFQPRLLKLGFYNTFQLGAWSPDALPVVLTLSSSSSEFLCTITSIHNRLGQPFILLAPTNRHFTSAARQLLDSMGSLLFALEDQLRLAPTTPSPARATAGHPSAASTDLHSTQNLPPTALPSEPQFQLVSVSPPAKLFAQIAPLRPDPSDEELARRTFIALQQYEHGSRRKSPTLYAVFELYCLKNLTIPQVASKCRCSLGTVANRLNLLRSRTGVSPELLRRASPHFLQFQEDFRQAQRNHRRRSSRRFES